MFRTPKVGTRALAGIATIATITGVSLPLMATAASAAVSAVTANPSSYQAASGSTVAVTADVTRTAGDTTPIRFAVVSGPDADAATNGTLVADGTCVGATTPVSCSVANLKGPGTDVVRIFADTNANLVLDSGEPSSDATIVFYGAAAAVDLKPDSDSAAAGTCNAFTVTVTDAGGRARPGQVVRLEATLTGTTTSRVIAFCDPDGAGPATNAGGDDSTAGTGSPTQAQGAVTTTTSTTATNGTATFGIRSDQPGTATVRAFVDSNANGTFDAGEASDTSTKTFTAGGAGGNTAQDAVTTLAVTPTSQSAIVGDSVSYTVTARNAAGDTNPNVVVNYTITGANPSSGALGATDNNGQTTLTYTVVNAGTDTITFFVNQTSGATSGADASEPKATATTTTAAAPSGYTVDLTCKGTSANITVEDCVDPLSDADEVFTAFVSKGVDGSGKPIPAAGILVRFGTANVTAPGTPVVSPTSAVTDAKGIATTTLTDATKANNTKDSVTATIAGQVTPQAGGVNADTGSKTWETPAPKTVTVTPALNTTQTGQASTFVATVTNQFGAPVAGVNVDFFIAGRNAALNGPALLDKTTDANGNATLTYTDTGAAAVTGTDTITARADLVENDAADPGEPSGTATNNFITEPAVAGTVDLDVTGAGTCGVTTTDPANDSKSYAPSTATHSVCALVKTAGGAPLAGKTVTFTISGVGSFAKADGTALTSPQTAVTDASGVASVLVTSTKSGAQNVSAAIDGKSDAATITYTAPTIGQARFIDLKPEAGNIASGSSVELTALVTDRFGNPVQGVPVSFSETGAGNFSNGTSSASGTTGATGTVTVTLTSPAGSTGTESVTASIDESNIAVLFVGGTQCGDAANTVDGAATPNTAAGNCADTEDYTFKAAIPAGKTPTISIFPTAINVGKSAVVAVTGTPGHTVQILAYSRPDTTYNGVRQGTFDANGQVTFTVAPRTNTRLFAKDVTSNLSSASGVISVRPAEALHGTASGKFGAFTGQTVPGHAGVQVRLFTVKNGVKSSSPVGTAVTDSNGRWSYSRNFAASGPVTFISQTLSDLTNLSGQSNRVTVTFS